MTVTTNEHKRITVSTHQGSLCSWQGISSMKHSKQIVTLSVQRLCSWQGISSSSVKPRDAYHKVTQ
jgi:hypothetical protein